MKKVDVKVLLFAKAKELSGKQEVSIVLDSFTDYQTLLSTIIDRLGLQQIGQNILLAVNENYICHDEEVTLQSGDIIAVIPPLSGGMEDDTYILYVTLLIFKCKLLYAAFAWDNSKMDYVKLVDTDLNINEITEIVKSPKCGAVSLFIGVTRDNCDGLQVKNLVYEAYEAMAIKAMKRVCEDIRKMWPVVENIAIYHRLGDVAVTEASVVIAISSPHRQESLQAVQFAIDKLKASVPVWKKEEYKDSNMGPAWKENKECPWSSS